MGYAVSKSAVLSSYREAKTGDMPPPPNTIADTDVYAGGKVIESEAGIQVCEHKKCD